MNNRLTQSWGCRRPSGGASRGGFTLIEVVAGLAILGSLLVAVVLAKGRHTQQWSQANRQLQAVEAADAMLTTWWSNTAGVPRSGSGQTTGPVPFRWQTRIVPHEEIERLSISVVRLEIHDQSDRGSVSPLVTVDVVVPDKVEDDEE